MPTEPVHDWLIVGSGPGGAVAADVLLSRGLEVTILERGQPVDRSHVSPFSTSEMSQHYKFGGANAVLGFPIVQIGEGEAVGGGSEINSGFYHRLPESVREQWQQSGLKHFSSEELQSYYESIESRLHLQDVSSNSALVAQWKSLCALNNLQWVEPKSWMSSNQRTTMSSEFLRSRSGLSIQPGCDVKWVEKIRGQWRVHMIKNGQRETVICKNLVLSAGTLSTWELLKNSGLNHQWRTPFFIHPQVRVLAKYPQKNSDSRWIPNLQIKTSTGHIGFSTSQAGFMAAFGAPNAELMNYVSRCHNQLTCLYASIVPQSSGWLSGVAPTYFFSKTDRQSLKSAFQDLCQRALDSGAEEIVPLTHNARVIQSHEELRRFISQLSIASLKISSVHVMGSLGCGESKSRPVDSFGRWKRQENLFISDASLFNSAIGVNPQGTIMMMAQRNAGKW